MSAPNQEYWTMHTYSREQKEENSKKRIPFIYAAKADAMTAMKRLTGNGFKLWYYLADNKSGTGFFASAEKIKAETGLTEREYRGAKESLKEQGFLVWEEKNRFSFHVTPQEPRLKPTKKQQADAEEKRADAERFLDSVASLFCEEVKCVPDHRRRTYQTSRNDFENASEYF